MTSVNTCKDKGKGESVRKAAKRKPDFEVAVDWGDVLENLEAVQQAM